MIYLLIKAVHVTSVLVFVGGLLMLVVLGSTPNLVGARALRRWDGWVTSPALLLMWITGLTIASQGHWFEEAWLAIKLAIVTCLSAMHGMLAGALRRSERGAEPKTTGFVRYAAPATVAAVAIVTFLVVVKPSF
jgi:protoporphyrinogen IX oxidase